MSDAATARRSHSIRSAVREGFAVWYALLGGIGAWAIHLVALASLVRLTCNAHRYEWVLHAITGITLAMTAVAIGLSRRLMRAGGDDDSTDTESGRAEFLGRLGIIVGVANFALISLEELYVILLHTRPCG
jgi:hypothetical protein